MPSLKFRVKKIMSEKLSMITNINVVDPDEILSAPPKQRKKIARFLCRNYGVLPEEEPTMEWYDEQLRYDCEHATVVYQADRGGELVGQLSVLDVDPKREDTKRFYDSLYDYSSRTANGIGAAIYDGKKSVISLRGIVVDQSARGTDLAMKMVRRAAEMQNAVAVMAESKSPQFVAMARKALSVDGVDGFRSYFCGVDITPDGGAPAYSSNALAVSNANLDWIAGLHPDVYDSGLPFWDGIRFVDPEYLDPGVPVVNDGLLAHAFSNLVEWQTRINNCVCDDIYEEKTVVGSFVALNKRLLLDL